AGGWVAYEQERRRARHRAVEAHERAVSERERLAELARAARRRSAHGQRNARAENDKNLRHLYEQTAQRVSGGLAAQLDRKAARVQIPDRPWQDRSARLPYLPPAS